MLPYIKLGPLELGTFGLLVWVALLVSYYVIRADIRRRRLPGDPANLVIILGVAGVIGAKLYSAFEYPAEFWADPAGTLFSRFGFTWHGSLIAGILVLLWWARRHRIPYLVMFDVAAPAAALGYGIGRLGCLTSGDGDYGIPTALPWCMRFPEGLVPTNQCVHPTPVYELLLAALIFWFLWREGRRAAQLQRPAGLVLGEYFVLTGAARFFIEFIRDLSGKSFPFGEQFGRGFVEWYNRAFGIELPPGYPVALDTAQLFSLAEVLLGLGLIAWLVPRFLKEKEEHRIIEHAAVWGEATQPEYTPASPECPHPERWRMYDSMSAEVEVLDFLKKLVTTLKPELIVETGTFTALSTIKLAEGLRENGFGRLITIEYDPKVFAAAQERVRQSGVAKWIEMRNESSLEARVDGRIDLLFCDSALDIREQEVRHFLPQMNPHGVILLHDASSHYKVVREQAQRLQSDGLISVVFLPTPRGLVIAQKREGRK